jgi:two-component system heavy metal sensor histidine kinase CusS
MSSKSDPERTYSLTRRLAVRFAAITSLLLVGYGGWSGYMLVETLRDETHSFLSHELDELSLHIRQSDGSPEAIRRCAEDIARVTREPPTGFRVRDRRGTIVAESGRKALFERHPGPLSPDVSWREFLFSDGVAVAAREMKSAGLTLEIVSDAGAVLSNIRRGGLSLILSTAIAVVLAAFAGWFSAHSGLRGIREVVSRARDIHGVDDAEPIELGSAPSEVRDLSLALNAMLGRIRRGLADLRTFTAGLAHELRSPLQNLLGETEVALLADRSPEEYRETLRSNLGDLHALADAVDNLVAWCRTSDPGRRDRNAEAFDLADEAELRLSRERRTARRDGVELVVERAGNTRIRADREGILRVLRNLAGNAIGHSPPGGRVDVRILGDADAVRIVVEDRGPGVPADLVDRMFEPFVSGRADKGRRGGYGLGLAICRTVAGDHGGTCRYEPREGGGARFIAEIPRDGPAISEPTCPGRTPGGPSRGRTP